MPLSIVTLVIKYEDDLVTARQRARQVAHLLGFDDQDQTRISAAVSEVARVVLQQQELGEVEFLLEGDTPPQLLLVKIWRSSAPAVRMRRTKATGEGLAAWKPALDSAGRLMDQCRLAEDEGATTIWLKKMLPKGSPLVAGEPFERLKRQLARLEPQNPMEEVRHQNQELLHALDEVHERQQELVRLNRELEDTNRGVVALYAELDEKASHLRRADEMKSRFLSNMSHEFRTPLNAVLALSQLLLDRTDGDLTPEQEKQVRYIRKSGEDLLELVNDLLDLAKIEAGKINITPAPFEIGTLFSALRGMLRPLLVGGTVNLLFEEPDELPVMHNDEGKVSQILRNFISNAIKFTEQGEVRVRAALADGGQAVAFSVTDTGIGIAEEDQARIFEEFSQIDHPIQRRVKGTGLGLPLCRSLAKLLGGTVTVESRLGVGSTFTAVIPLTYPGVQSVEAAEAEPVQAEPGLIPVLLVEDEPETRMLYEKYLRHTPYQAIPAGSIRQARALLERYPIAAIVLDILLPDETAWQWLAQLKGRAETARIPVFVVSSVDDPRKALALGADDYCLKPVRRDWLLERLERATQSSHDGLPAKAPVALIIDDQETDRYILRRSLAEVGWSAREASSGEEGVACARGLRPDLILLDLNMPGMDGFAVMGRLQSDAATKDIPVIIVTSQIPLPDLESALMPARAILAKHDISAATWSRVFHQAGLGALAPAAGRH